MAPDEYLEGSVRRWSRGGASCVRVRLGLWWLRAPGADGRQRSLGQLPRERARLACARARVRAAPERGEGGRHSCLRRRQLRGRAQVVRGRIEEEPEGL